MVEGFGKVIKLLMFLSNLIIFVGGITLLAIGIWTLVDQSVVEKILGTDRFVAAAVIMIVVGAIISLISFIGTLGAYKESRCMLVTFFVILLMILLVLIAGAVLAYVFRSDVDEKMQSEMINTIRLYGVEKETTNTWDIIQRSFNCCGVTPYYNTNQIPLPKPYSSWWENTKFRSPNTGAGEPVPWSCCVAYAGRDTPTDEASRKGCAANFPALIHQDDCYIKIKDYLSKHALIVGGIGIVISIMLILGMAFSCALCYMIK